MPLAGKGLVAVTLNLLTLDPDSLLRDRLFRICAFCQEDVSGSGDTMPGMHGFEYEPGKWRCVDKDTCRLRVARRFIEAASGVGPAVAFVTQMVFGTVPGSSLTMTESTR